MAKKTDCCPCPITVARAKARTAKTCDQLNAAADAFLHAASDDLAMRKAGPEKVKYERLLNAEFDRIAEKAAIRCQYAGKSEKAVDALTRARLDVRRAIQSRQRADEAAKMRIQRAMEAQQRASALEGHRRRRAH